MVGLMTRAMVVVGVMATNKATIPEGSEASDTASMRGACDDYVIYYSFSLVHINV
jgi:hypothetical protein